MLLETKWIRFMCALLQQVWPWACLRPGSAQQSFALAWPQSAFLSHAAPDLLTHFLTQEIELTPLSGPWGPKATYTAVRQPSPVQTQQSSTPLQLNRRQKREV